MAVVIIDLIVVVIVGLILVVIVDLVAVVIIGLATPSAIFSLISLHLIQPETYYTKRKLHD